ncbi:MAG: ABC transporter ATP-binding protein, partial [Gammaproteobacteria bacterium]|nr:ABC transporter ATP-binding protein [Gammaproteobacteria bacterium]
MNKKFLDISHVTMQFETDNGMLEVLKDINLNLVKGEFVSLIGHSGCG